MTLLLYNTRKLHASCFRFLFSVGIAKQICTTNVNNYCECRETTITNSNQATANVWFGNDKGTVNAKDVSLRIRISIESSLTALMFVTCTK